LLEEFPKGKNMTAQERLSYQVNRLSARRKNPDVQGVHHAAIRRAAQTTPLENLFRGSGGINP
jgi:hypothetical protein